MPKLCTPACRHLRSIRYGFDGKPITAAGFDKRDKMATCAKNPKLRIVLSGQPVCQMEVD